MRRARLVAVLMLMPVPCAKAARADAPQPVELRRLFPQEAPVWVAGGGLSRLVLPPAILAACREAGVEWYIVEQDHCQRDPFESLGISLRNLKAMGLQ